MHTKLNQITTHYYSLTDEREIERVELLAQSTFNTWSKITWVKFTFVYANNVLNRRVGRVGQVAGTRIGTRNLALIPEGDTPNSRNPSSKTKRYYDVTRANATVRGGISSGGLTGTVTGNEPQQGQWRSFRPSTFTIMTEVWSFDKKAWISKLSDYYRKAKRIK